jgi:hypothetical protein
MDCGSSSPISHVTVIVSIGPRHIFRGTHAMHPRAQWPIRAYRGKPAVPRSLS